METNIKDQSTESSWYEEEPVSSKSDVNDEEKTASSRNSKILNFDESEELLTYQKTLLNAAEKKSSDMILSNGLSYSLRLIYAIISTANKNIRMVLFDNDKVCLYYKQIIDIVALAKSKGVVVQILTNVDLDAELEHIYEGNIKEIPNQVYEQFLQSLPAFRSFITGDDCMYRLEFALDNEPFSGLGCFYDPDMTSNFIKLFDNFYKKC